MLLIDAGSSYIKFFDTETLEQKILHISDYKKNITEKPDYITGHNANIIGKTKYVNELVALAEGAKTLCIEKDFTVLDIGSRDMKLVSFKDGNFDHCDWNSSCGAMVGFTIELIMKYFNKTTQDLKPSEQYFDITCGLLGITKFFDKISADCSIEEGISSLINGMARFSWQFAGKPSSLYLSGGLSENPIFIDGLKKLVPELKPLGRFVLVEGLKNVYTKK